jgi:hypothetical protein
MFDPHFKSLQGVENYVGCEDYIFLVHEFDANLIILFLILVFEILNRIIQACVAIVVWSNDFIEEDHNIFGVDASMEKFVQLLFENYLYSKGYP